MPRFVATSLYGRVEVARNTQRQEPADPVVFSGSIGTPQFSPDGQRLLILSGAILNMLDSMRLIDVSQLYRPQEAAPEKLEEDLRLHGWPRLQCRERLRPSGDGSLMTLEDCAEEVSRKQSR